MSKREGKRKRKNVGKLKIKVLYSSAFALLCFFAFFLREFFIQIFETMNIYYQGVPGAFGWITAKTVAKKMNIEGEHIIGCPTFAEVWKQVDKKSIAVVPVENSRAGSVHDNLYNFIRYDYVIIGEVYTKINHTLLSKEKDKKLIKKVFSHPQALYQCDNYLKKNHFQAEEFFDTAGAVEMVAKSEEKGIAAIASAEAGKLYGLNMLEKGIQDQEGNETRFLIITEKGSKLKYPTKTGKTAILFTARDIPASLYKCLGAFATNNVNLTKIESIPRFEDPFMYTFWLEFEGKVKDENVRKSLNELSFFAKKVQIMGEY